MTNSITYFEDEGPPIHLHSLRSRGRDGQWPFPSTLFETSYVSGTRLREKSKSIHVTSSSNDATLHDVCKVYCGYAWCIEASGCAISALLAKRTGNYEKLTHRIDFLQRLGKAIPQNPCGSYIARD